MIVNPQTLDLAFKGFQKVVTDAAMSAPAFWVRMDEALTRAA